MKAKYVECPIVRPSYSHESVIVTITIISQALHQLEVCQFFLLFINHQQLGTVLAVGSYGDLKRTQTHAHNKAELYYHSKSLWVEKAEYMHGSYPAIDSFQMIAYLNYFILLGGSRVGVSVLLESIDLIAKFDPNLNEWSEIGKLVHKRRAFGVIEHDNKFFVLGGYGTMPTETCELKNGKFVCTSREPTLTDFQYSSAMMIVSSDYANNC